MFSKIRDSWELETDDNWSGNLFQMLDATDEENDFENTIKVFLKGTKMIVKAEDRCDREVEVFQQGKKAVGSVTHWKQW